MYQGMNLKLSSNNIVIISPNSLFSKYISNVLPELGEENIQELTFENIFLKMFDNKLSVKTKSEQFEDMICAESNEKRSFLRQVAEFKGSDEFMEIMRRFVKYFERKLIPFEDVYFNGKYIESRQLLKALLLSNKLNMPTAKKLKIIENRLMEQVHQLKLERRKKIEEVVNESNNHEFEIKSFTRVLAAKETAAFTKALHKFTEFDVYELYKNLFSDKNLFYKISKGLKLPSNIEEIIDFTTKNIEDRFNIQYADGIGLMYLKIIAEGCDFYYDMKQVIIDEAQDYYPVHYNIIKEIFREARFTVVGDVNQAAEKQADLSIYDKITSIFGKRKNSKVFLTKSYRSSYEISKFSKNLLDTGIDTEFFRRSEETPKIKSAASIGELEDMMLKDISSYKSQGFESIAILCKSRKQAVELYMRLSGKTDLKLIDYVGNESISGVTVVPVYMAKGLEFDAVMVYNTDDENYRDSFDKRLLYIACTRALHRLSMYYTGNITCFLK
jgi:DNA helicase-2/ATP-dependent DNA helicase PcrA